MKRVFLLAILTIVAAFATVGMAFADSLSGVGTPVLFFGTDSCPNFAPITTVGQPDTAVGWTISGDLTPIPPVDPNNLLQPFQSDRTITLGGSFVDSVGEVWNVSGTLRDTTVYLGLANGVSFDGFGTVKLKGDQGDQLRGDAEVRFITGPGELDFYFTPAPPFALIQPPDIGVGVSKCHVRGV